MKNTTTSPVIQDAPLYWLGETPMRPLFLLPVFSMLLGCEQAQPFLPTVSFERMEVLEIDFDGVEADFVFEVYNPNPISVSAARFDYALAFADIELLSGEEPDGWQFAASGASELSLPTGFGFQTLFDVVDAVRGQDDIDFALSGAFGFDTPLGPLDLPFDEGGAFPAPRKPKISLDRLFVQDLSILGADLQLDLAIDNDHGSRLEFLDLDWDVELAGISVAGQRVQQWGEVEGATTGILSVPISLDFISVGQALYQALTQQTVDATFNADVSVDTPFGILPLELAASRTLDLER
ncbi:MAG: LEA type 2 family protein [Myxococcota bacterium]|nr:LEA type 2 family protein [Myxococcota bacterium]